VKKNRHAAAVEKKRFEKSRIPGSLSSLFDDFLRDVLVEEKYSDYLENEIILLLTFSDFT
jgi:hypothetical protein